MLSIIIPAYNEEQHIFNTVKDLTVFFEGEDYEIIISADGCTDKTIEISKQLAASNPRIKITSSEKRLGKGGGLWNGFCSSNGDIIVFADADGSSSPNDVRKLITYLNEADAVIGSRGLSSSRVIIPQPLYRRALGVIFRNFVNFLFQMNISDTQCGYKAFKRNALEKTFHRSKRMGFEFDVELLYAIKEEGFYIREVPITWKNRKDSKVTAYDAIKMFLTLLELKLSLLFSASRMVSKVNR